MSKVTKDKPNDEVRPKRDYLVIGLICLNLITTIALGIAMAQGSLVYVSHDGAGTIVTITQLQTTTATTTMPSFTTVYENRTVNQGPTLLTITGLPVPAVGSGKNLSETFIIEHYFTQYLFVYDIHLPSGEGASGSQVVWSLLDANHTPYASGGLSGAGRMDVTQYMHGAGNYTVVFQANADALTLDFQILGD